MNRIKNKKELKEKAMFLKKTNPRKLMVILIASLVLLNLACVNTTNKHSTTESLATNEPGLGSIHLSAEAIRTGKIEIAELTTKKIQPQLRVPGEVVFNPKKYYRLTSRVSGRVEELLAYGGDRVKKGQVLARLFSLQFLEGVTELRLAYERVQKMEKLSPGEQSAAQAVLNSAKEKLRLLGLGEAEIDILSRQPSGENLFPVTAHADGQIISSKVLRGDTVEAGSLLMEIASLDELWVEAKVQEKDLALVNPGQDAVIKVSSFPEAEFNGKVTYLSPVLDDSTRTVKARVEVRNRDGRLRPGMYAEVFILLPEASILAIPEEAVQEISGKKVVFVPEAEGVFVTREIKTGNPVDGWLPVLEGLAAGEKYVAQGAFLLKSEMLKSTFGEE